MDCSHLDAFDPAGEVLDVDDLLDFSITDDDIGGLIEAEDYCAPSSSSSTSTLSGLCGSSQASEKNSLSRAPEGGALCCPPGELPEFDWFSSFVAAEDDDIIPCSVEKAFIINKPGAAGDGGPKVDEDHWSNERIVSYCFPKEADDDCSSTRNGGGGRPPHQKEERLSVLRWEYKDRRARSKRARTGGRVWTLYSGRLVQASRHSHGLSGIDYEEEVEEEEEKGGRRKRPRGKQSKRRKARVGGGERGRGREEEPPRACSHCQVTKTPQWRAGPAGPKSLCNACGVRFKSGRLLPEYRPAASPTFLTDLHSNSHKKVLEMRRSKQESPPFPFLSTISHSPSHSCLSNVS